MMDYHNRIPRADFHQSDTQYDIEIFPRLSAWAVLGLIIITLGFYMIYWMVSRASILNTRSEYTISKIFTFIAIILAIFSFLGLFVDLFYPESYGLIVLRTIVLLVAFIWNMIFIFKIRHRINVMTGSLGGETTHMKGIFTFFFTAIYMQYKLNQMIDESMGNY